MLRPALPRISWCGNRAAGRRARSQLRACSPHGRLDFERRRDDDDLTVRKCDVVRLVALGHTSREIAERLVLSVRTVETHRARIQRRLGRHASGAVNWALEHGLVEP